MPNVEQEIIEIRKYFVTWITEVKLAAALDYFDINKISEGTAQRLLNIVFDYQLQDLNREKKNFPGIDLGDRNKGIAFQVTSRNDPAKIKESLKTFVSNNYNKDFSSGLRFFIINQGKRPSLKSDILEEYKSVFNIKKDVFFPEDLIKLIEDIYYSNPERFAAVKQFLYEEFGKPYKQSSIIHIRGQKERLDFYKQLFLANNENLLNKFVPFVCKFGKEEVQSEQLSSKLFSSNGILIIGPSGCGKSILARTLALTFLNTGFPVVLEAKYYEIDLNTLFEKAIKSYGFSNGVDYFTLAKASQQKPLLIIDGLNECSSEARPKLLLELEYIKRTYNALVLITTQEEYDGMAGLNLTPVYITNPDLATKNAIAIKYGGNKFSNKLNPLLEMATTSLESKMIGEITIDKIEKISRFTIFELFIKNKLKDFKIEGFLFLTNIAQVLSDKISFNLSERSVEKLLQSEKLTEVIYKKCLSEGLLEFSDGKVSFSHEMFYNFFVANSIVRSAENADQIITQINAPKNYDKKLMIVGAIEDSDTLDKVLSDLTDIELLSTLYAGDGGDYCKLWIDYRLRVLLDKIKIEIQQIKFEFGENSLNGIQINPNSVLKWTLQETALINLLAIILIKNKYLKEVFELVGMMDNQCYTALRELFNSAKEKNINARSAIFSTTYIGFGINEVAITKMFSQMKNTFPRNTIDIGNDSIQKILNNKSIKHGQFYFLLLLLKFDDKLHNLYPYVLGLLNNWRKTPYHILIEVLQQINCFYITEKERKDLIDILKSIHSETQNIWLSTALFEALDDLDALSEDAADFESTVSAEIIEILTHQDVEEYWNRAAEVYNAQFDHPYAEAYFKVIDKLNEQDKCAFFQMALQGDHSSIFTITLITNSWKLLGKSIAPYLIRWTEVPIINESFPQDSLTLFFLSHLLLAKSNYPIVSRYSNETGEKNRSLFAIAEIYYWINKTDDDSDQNQQKAKIAADILFETNNPYIIDSIAKLRESMMNCNSCYQLTPDSVIEIDSIYPEQVVAASRSALLKLGSQKDIFDFPRSEVNLNAIGFIELHGSIIDVDLLKTLTENPLYGESAIRVIKKLSS